MSSQRPPPLPDPNSACRIYLRAILTLIPTIFIWLFADLFLVAKLKQLWGETGLSGSKAQWLMTLSDTFHQNFNFIVPGLMILLLFVELRWAAWPRYRRAVVAGIVLFFHTAVLVGVTTIATAALLAAPLLHKHNRH